MNLPLERIVYQWLRGLRIPVSSSYIEKKLRSHPDYPSIVSITDALDEAGIDNSAMVVDKDRINELPIPFLAHGYKQDEVFSVVNNIAAFTNGDGFAAWNGIVVADEKPEKWNNKGNEAELIKEKNSKKIRVALAASFLLGTIILAGFNFSWVTCSLLFTAVAGLFVSMFIIQNELGYANPVAEKLCGTGKNMDCDAVTKSKGAKIFPDFGWADAGIIYFSSLSALFFLSLILHSVDLLKPLSLLSLFSFVFTFYSLYYQWRVVKKWCTLCLVTVSLLWIQAILFYIAGYLMELAHIPLSGIVLSLFLFLCAGSLWLVMLKPALKRNKELKDENFELLRFRNNPEIFDLLLQQQPVVDTIPFENDLQTGNSDAFVQLMVACNPYCAPCAKAHRDLELLLDQTDTGLTIRFAINADNHQDAGTEAVKKIVQAIPAGKKDNPGYIRKLLHDWYELMNLEKFLSVYKTIDDADVYPVLKRHEAWAAQARIEATPTVFINGRKLPARYSIKDLAHIIACWKPLTMTAAEELKI